MTSGLRANILHSNYVYCSLALSVVCLFEAALKECKHWRRYSYHHQPGLIMVLTRDAGGWGDFVIRWKRLLLLPYDDVTKTDRQRGKSSDSIVESKLDRTKEDPNKYRLITGFIATVVYFNSPAPSPHWFICRWKARRCGWANAKNGREKDGDSIHDTQSSSTAWWKSSFSIACKYLIKFH